MNRLCRLGGYLCRIAVIGTATTAITLFFVDAIQLELSRGYLVAVSFLAVLLAALFRLGRRTALAGGIGLLGGFAYVCVAFRDSLSDCLYALPALWNACLARFERGGFAIVADMQIPYDTTLSDTTLLYIGMTMVVLLIGFLYTLSLLRRVNLIPPTVLTTTLLVVLCTFNLFTNQQPNLDIVLLLASFAAVLVLASYDHVHRPPRQASSQVRQPHDATGGYVAIASLLVFALLLAVPARLVQGNFRTVEPIDSRVDYLRNYMTALLRGDSSRLDELAYQGDRDSSRPRNTDAEQLSFTGKELMYIQTGYNAAYYLTGWIATDYRDGAWYAASKAERETYRQLFGTEDSPAEELREGFYSCMLPGFRTADTLPTTASFFPYGTVTTQVSLRRLSATPANASACYLPAVYAPRYGLLDHDSYSASSLSFLNYYDGIRTGRAFSGEVSYSSVAYLPVMTHPYWAINLSDLSESWSAMREKSLIQTHLSSDPADSRLTLAISTDGDLTRFTYHFAGEQEAERQSWSFSHPTAQVSYLSTGDIVVSRGDLFLVICMDGSRVTDAELFSSLYSSVGQRMPEEDELAEMAELALSYGNFVYDTYCTPSGSDLLATLADQLRAQHRIPDTAGTRELSGDQAVILRDRAVREVIRYLIEDGRFQYTLTPDTSSVDASLDGVENFLLNTKQGYCVQFASAAALLLREYGIPTRYVEGYIACDLTPSDDGSTWGGYVHDYQAHAWVEVYFDGIGWIPYEATPAYYDAVHTPDAETWSPTTSSPETRPSPIPPAPTPSVSETTDETDAETTTGITTSTGGETSPEVEPGTLPSESGTELSTTASKPPLSKRLLPLWLLLAVVALLLYGCWARHRGTRCRRLAERLLREGCPPEELRPRARELADALYRLLALYGLSPRVGELADAYADRLTDYLSDRLPQADIPSMRHLFEIIAAEEFGRGMTSDELSALAAGYLFLHCERRRLCSPVRRLYLRLIRHAL